MSMTPGAGRNEGEYPLPKTLCSSKCASDATPKEGSPHPGWTAYEWPVSFYACFAAFRLRRALGTYSLGDGIRYEEFAQFPPGFSVENYVDDTAAALSAMVSTDAQAPIVCSNE